MARPVKNNADWFKHDADMRNDLKVKALRRKFQHEGYAVWNYLLESLADAEYFELEYTDLTKELLAADFDTTPERLDEIVNMCIRMELLVEDEGKIYSRTMKKRMNELLSKRKRDRAYFSERKSMNDDVSDDENQEKETFPTPKTHDDDISDTENPHNRIDNSREDNNRNPLSISPSLVDSGLSSAERENILSVFFFKGVNKPVYEMEEFINHYTAREWFPNNSSKAVLTPRGRVALAKNWTPKSGIGRFPNCKACMSWLNLGYSKAVDKFGIEKAGAILRDIEDIRPVVGKEREYEIRTTQAVYGMLSKIDNPLVPGMVEDVKWKKSAKQLRVETEAKK